MSPSTAEIAEAVQEYVAELYAQLFGVAPLLIVGLVVFAVGMGALAHALSKRFPSAGGASPTVRIVMGFALAATCAFALGDIDNHGGIVGVVVIILASIAAIVGLATRRRWTMYVIVGIIWLYLAPFEVTCVAGALLDRSQIGTFAPIGQLGVFATDNYVVYHAVAATLLAIGLSFAVLLLLGERETTSAPIALPDVGFEIETDKIIYICIAIALLVIAVPAFIYGDMPGYLSDDTASISNAYVERLNEYLNDNTVNEDAAWMSPFTTASEELYEADTRFLDIDPGAVRRSDLVLYILYSEASFKQMEAIENIHANVAAGEAVDGAALASFNSSIEEQTDALAVRLNSIAVDDFLNEAPRIAYDSAFFYLRTIGLGLFGWVLIAAGVLCGVAAFLIMRHKARVTCAAMTEDISAHEGAPLVYDVHVGPAEQPAQTFTLKPAAKIALIVGVVALAIGYFVITEVFPAIDDQKEQENSAAFIEEASATVATRPVELALWLREAQKADESELTSEYLQAGIAMIDAQLAGLKTLETWDGLPEGSEDFGASVAELARGERPILEEMRTALAAGELPSQELISAYAELREGESGKRLEESLETFLVQYSIENALDLALDD